MNWMENCSFVGHNIFMKMWWECVNVYDNHFLAHFIWKFPPPKINSEGSVLVTVMSSVLVYLGLMGPLFTISYREVALFYCPGKYWHVRRKRREKFEPDLCKKHFLFQLFFAIICCYGFSMLASINTMDRFDDPKGKPIHVPQTE